MARSMWSGHISFGLVNIPIRLMTAVRDKGVHLHMLSPDGKCRLRRKLVCPETGEEFDFNQTVRGYEIAPDQYVVIGDEEADAIKPEAGRAIEITEFVELDQIDPMYYERAYYLSPGEGGAKAYQLLLRAMEEKGRVAIGRFVMRQKQYLAALRPHGGAIVLETMRYADEVVRADEELDLPKNVKVSKGELKMAEQLIDVLASDTFEPQKYNDDYRDRLMDLIETKAQGEEVVVHAPTEEEAPRVINLMEALQKSVAEKEKASKASKTRRKKSA